MRSLLLSIGCAVSLVSAQSAVALDSGQYITNFPWLSQCVSENSGTAGSNFEDSFFACDSGWTGKSSSGFGSTPSINKNGGTNDERWAKITGSITDSSNSVLEFGMKTPNYSENKGRVQLGVSAQGFRVIKFKVKMYLNDAHNLLKTYPDDFHWFDLSTIFNEDTWSGNRYPFVMSTRITKPISGDSELYFAVRARTYNPDTGRPNSDFWNYVATDFPVPVGEWMLLEHEMVEGDGRTGSYKLYVTPKDGVRRLLLDINNYTRHPDKTVSSPYKNLTPLKYYTSAAVIDHVTKNGGILKVQWDDLVMLGCNTDTDCVHLHSDQASAPAQISPPLAPPAFSVE